MASPSTTQHVIGGPAHKFRPIDSSRSGDVSSIVSGFSDNTADYGSIHTIDTELNIIDSVVFSQDRLNSMTFNDKTYALRLNRDPETF